VLGGAVVMLLILAAIVGHAAVSAGM
jgi:hypothetical protein